MTGRRNIVTLVIAASLACAWLAPAARADPPKPADTKPRGPTPKPKPAPTPKEPPRRDAVAPGAPVPAPLGSAAAAHEVVEHESRIEFDERVVHGQSATGAIFLFQRAPSEFKSIVDVPDSFRDKTIELVKPRRGTP